MTFGMPEWIITIILVFFVLSIIWFVFLKKN